MRNVARFPVLVAIESTGLVSVHAGQNIEVFVLRIPQSPIRSSEQMADDVAYMSVPKKFRHLYGTPAKASEVARPLKPSVALAAVEMQRLMDGLNELQGT